MSSDYYFIEGVGDEVVLFLGILMAIFIVVVSWLSTRVSDSSFATDNLLRHASQQANTSPSENQQPAEEIQHQNTPQEVMSQQSDEGSGAAAQSPDTLGDASREDSTGDESTEPAVLRRRLVQNTQTNQDASSPLQQQESATSSLSSNGTISIRLKFMDETIKTVEARPDETLESFRRRNLPPEAENRYRLIYSGQVLREGHRTLRELNLSGNVLTDPVAIPVIHCFLSPINLPGSGNLASSASQQMQIVAEELHIGSFLLPILGVCLLLMWYLCIFHTSLFSIQSIVSIVGFSFLYIALVVNQFL